jgi:hypothetical protein
VTDESFKDKSIIRGLAGRPSLETPALVGASKAHIECEIFFFFHKLIQKMCVEVLLIVSHCKELGAISSSDRLYKVSRRLHFKIESVCMTKGDAFMDVGYASYGYMRVQTLSTTALDE